jgi:DNA-binding transcriptional LysR family regulator
LISVQLDLNLLTALDALLEEGSVTGAAARRNVSPPAMSRTLGRIRHATGDQILVRTGRTMVPTPHALAIRGDVAGLVARSRRLLSPRRELDLTTLDRSFTVVAHDAAISGIGSLLLATVHAQAPGVTVRLLAEAAVDTPELARGQIDLEISGSRPTSAAIHTETVAHYPLAVAMRSRHKLARGPLTVERYAAAQHVTVSRRGRLHDPLDQALRARGLRRDVVASLPTVGAALDVLRGSDLLVVVAGLSATPSGLVLRPLPLELPAAVMNMSWHHRFDDDAAHQWLRDQARQALHRAAVPAR